MTRHLLLVGGDALVSEGCREFFKALHGDDYEVETVEHCDDALALLLRRPCDVVLLLSLRAPWRAWPTSESLARLTNETGMLFLSKMRALHSDVPLIVVSGAIWLMDRVLANGAFAFVDKPPDLRELDRAVADALGPSRDK